MRHYAIAIFSFVVSLALAAVAFSQANPRGFTAIDLNGHQVAVYYGRPSLKGKTIDQEVGRLKSGGFWRLGADESTTFTTMTSLKFGDVTVSRGTYSIWAQKTGANSWKLVFNHQYGIWGTQHDSSKDFASVPLKVTKSAAVNQMMKIMLAKQGNGGIFVVHWGDMELTTHFTTA